MSPLRNQREFRKVRCAGHFVFIMPRRGTTDPLLGRHGTVRGADPTGAPSDLIGRTDTFHRAPVKLLSVE